RADLLKAHAGMADLARISWVADDDVNRRALRRLRDPLERLQLDARMHDLRVLDVLRRVADGDHDLPVDLTHDLERLAASSTAAERVGLPSRAGDAAILAAATQ